MPLDCGVECPNLENAGSGEEGDEEEEQAGAEEKEEAGEDGDFYSSRCLVG